MIKNVNGEEEAQILAEWAANRGKKVEVIDPIAKLKSFLADNPDVMASLK